MQAKKFIMTAMKRFSGDKPEKKGPSKGRPVGKPGRPRNDSRNSDRSEGKSENDKPFVRRESSSDGGERKPYQRRDSDGGERKPYQRRDSEGGERKPYQRRDSDGGERKPYQKRDSEGSDRKPYQRRDSEGGERKPFERRDSEGGERKPYQRRDSEGGERKPYQRRDSEGGERKPFERRDSDGSERKPYQRKDSDGSERKPYQRRDSDSDERKPFQRRESEGGERKPYQKRDSEGGERKPYQRRDSEGNDRPWDSEKKSSYRGKPRFSDDRKDDGDRKPFRRDSGIAKKAPSRKQSSDDGTVRLNKYIANAGVCSRREADTMIEAGAVTVNGKVVTELGTKVSPDDKVQIGNDTLNPQKKVYLLLNKPKGYITTVDDPQERNTVMMLVKDACKERVYPVGRLDRNTSGLLLLTNDGEMAKKLTHPSHKVRKIYQVEVNKTFSKSDMVRLTEGIELEDGIMAVDEIAYTGSGEDKKVLGVVIHSGKNRVVRRLFEALEYEVVKLDRVAFANLTKKDLPRGRYRFLLESEINMLKMI